jgi:hypothetical protein
VTGTTQPVRYEADPHQLVRVFMDIRKRGLDLVAIYDSCPTRPQCHSRRTRWSIVAETSRGHTLLGILVHYLSVERALKLASNDLDLDKGRRRVPIEYFRHRPSRRVLRCRAVIPV